MDNTGKCLLCNEKLTKFEIFKQEFENPPITSIFAASCHLRYFAIIFKRCAGELTFTAKWRHRQKVTIVSNVASI